LIITIIRPKVILCVAFLFPSFSVSAEKIHLQLRWHHQFQFAGYYAGSGKRIAAEAEIKKLAYIDTLTGLDNRHHFLFWPIRC
jgi:PleD family two-component response regulator